MSKNLNSDATLASKVAAGVTKHLMGVATLTFGKGAIPPAQLLTQLQLLVSLRQAVLAAQAVVRAKLADEAAQEPTIRAILIALVAFLRLTYADQPDVLADFGVAPRKPSTPLTTAQRAAANAKRKATQQARGIVGSKKRKEISGNVTGVIVTPIVAAPATSIAAAPSAIPTGTGATGGTPPHSA